MKLDTLEFVYHYDAKSGALFVPRAVKAYVDGTPYNHPGKDGTRFVRKGKTILFEVVNRQRVRKLLSVMGDTSKLDAVTL